MNKLIGGWGKIVTVEQAAGGSKERSETEYTEWGADKRLPLIQTQLDKNSK